MTVLIDSWAWIEYFKGTSYGEQARQYIEAEEEVITSAINVAEVYHFLLRNRQTGADKLISFLLKTSFVSFVSTEISLQAAKSKHQKKLGLADAIVLATAMKHKAKIVTGDDDFRSEPNVIYIGK